MKCRNGHTHIIHNTVHTKYYTTVSVAIDTTAYKNLRQNLLFVEISIECPLKWVTDSKQHIPEDFIGVSPYGRSNLSQNSLCSSVRSTDGVAPTSAASGRFDADKEDDVRDNIIYETRRHNSISGESFKSGNTVLIDM